MNTIIFLLLLTTGMMGQVTVMAQEVVFDPFEWAETNLAQVQFLDNPKKDRAFFITPPNGWVRVKDLTNMFNADLVKKMTKTQIRDRFQSVYPYVVVAKSLDALAWNLDPYNFRTPMADLQNFAQDFLLDQYAEYKQLPREANDQEKLYELLAEEVADQEFSLKVTLSVCDKPSMKRSCGLLRSRKLMFDLTDTSLDFTKFPKSLYEFRKEIIPQLNQWFAASRRLFAFRELMSAVEEKHRPKKPFIIRYEDLNKPEIKPDLAPKFFESLWDKINVLVFADYCAFPELICNKFDRKDFQLPLTNKTVEILVSIKLTDDE